MDEQEKDGQWALCCMTGTGAIITAKTKSKHAKLKVRRLLYMSVCIPLLFLCKGSMHKVLYIKIWLWNIAHADSHYTSIEHQAVQTRLLVSVIELGYFLKN